MNKGLSFVEGMMHNKSYDRKKCCGIWRHCLFIYNYTYTIAKQLAPELYFTVCLSSQYILKQLYNSRSPRGPSFLRYRRPRAATEIKSTHQYSIKYALLRFCSDLQIATFSSAIYRM